MCVVPIGHYRSLDVDYSIQQGNMPTCVISLRVYEIQSFWGSNHQSRNRKKELSAKPRAQGRVKGFWGGQAAVSDPQERALSKAPGAGKGEGLLGGPGGSLGTARKSSQQQGRVKGFWGGQAAVSEPQERALSKAPGAGKGDGLLGGPGGSFGPARKSSQQSPGRREG